MEKIYKPNVGWVFWAHLILILVVILPLMAVLMILGSPGGLLIPVLLILLAMVIVSMLVVYKTMYIMDDENITVRGVFKKREIPYGTVTKIINTDKGMPSGEGILVLSPDRIVILSGENVKVSLSPLDKPDALDALRSCCPDAEYEEDLKAGKAGMETEADVPENDAVPDAEEDITNSEEEDLEAEAGTETEADVPENDAVPDAEEDITNSEEEEQEETSE